MAAFPESHRDLLETDVAMLSTVGRDGYPQATAITMDRPGERRVAVTLRPVKINATNLGG